MVDNTDTKETAHISKKTWAFWANIISSMGVIFAMGLLTESGGTIALILTAVTFIIYLAGVISVFISFGWIIGFLIQLLVAIIFSIGMPLITRDILPFPPIELYVVVCLILSVISFIFLVKSFKG